MTKLPMSLGLMGVVLASGAGLASAGQGAGLAKLPKEVQPMHCMVGEWRGTGTLEMGDTKGSVTVSMSCRATSSGYGVACDSRFKGMPGGDQTETDLFGFDPGQNKYHWFAVTSMGETHDHVADAPAANTLQWVYRGQQDGKALVEAIEMTMSEDGKRIDLHNDGTLDGARAWQLIGSVSKK
jgi:hypothetical protein